MRTLTEEGVDALRARLDATPTPPEWDDDFADETPTEEVEIAPVVADPDNLRVLHLTADQWDAVDALAAHGVHIRGVGAGCAHTASDPTAFFGEWPWGWWLDCLLQKHDVTFRPSPVIGGTFLLFDLSPSFPGA